MQETDEAYRHAMSQSFFSSRADYVPGLNPILHIWVKGMPIPVFLDFPHLPLESDTKGEWMS